MREDIATLLRCPQCGDALELTIFKEDAGLVEEGSLACRACDEWFRIEQGICDLLPPSLRRHERHKAFAERHGLPLRQSNTARNAQKVGQVDFFIRSSQTYEDEITQSPYFSTLDEAVFAPWVRNAMRFGVKTIEVGCGSGRQSLPMAGAGADVLGVDISEEMLRVARNKASQEGLIQRVNFVVADADNLPVSHESFDNLVIVGALHHMENPERALSAAVKALAPGGRFFIYDPHDSPLRFLFDWLMSVCKLYEEEAGDDPLFREEQLKGYFNTLNLEARIRISTYLPPHLFYLFGPKLNRFLLRSTDAVLSAIPGVRRCGGMIISTGHKKAAH